MRIILYLPLLVLIISASIAGCSDNTPLLEKVKKEGELIIVTRNSPTTYYLNADGPAGFEYDLAKLFADELGVTLKVTTPDSLTDIFPIITSGEAHFAAAGLTVTEKRKEWVRFGPVYQNIHEQVIYHKENPRPKDINELGDGLLEVVSGSSHVEQLEKLKTSFKNLTWYENDELESEELLALVWEQVIDYTIADSNEVALNQRFYPELKIAFDLSKPQSLAWAFPLSNDTSLYDAATAFFEKIQQNGELKNITARYYGSVKTLSTGSRRSFAIHFNERFPRYRKMYEAVAEENDLDWRLLAAIGYQESHWNPLAVSPTGVRGIMMLTRDTAKYLGVKDRVDPMQSIEGGARYFAQLRNSIATHIQEPARTWFAIASYNIGPGHVIDAQIITEKRGLDPDKWLDVKQSLPLLQKEKWYKNTKYGYARGNEAMRYVANVRTYYDFLTWIISQEETDEEKNNEAINLDSLAL
ncbi:MAG: membrane-bound lytic murein transglycosylase MltF [Gammaproteobacteria bacterium]|nr:membrane-bound lytic murein transglycosylase MltF [Gammaproteobacteria bacterium]